MLRCSLSVFNRFPVLDISIVVPTYNRPAQLERCLRSMTELEFNGQFEAIVVDDGGTVDLQELLDAFLNDLKVKLITIEHAGPSQARNIGVSAAHGTAIALIDDDCTFNPDWLTCMWHHFEKQTNDLLGGHTLNALETNVYSSASQLLVGYVYTYYNRNPEKGCFFTSSNMFMSKQQFLAVGGFDPRFKGAGGEDREFCDRWHHLGKNLKYIEDATLMHFHDLSLRGFIRQHYNYGHGAWLYHQCRKQRLGAQFNIEPFNFYWKLISEAWRAGSPRPLTTTVLLLASQAANAIGLLVAKLEHGFKPEVANP